MFHFVGCGSAFHTKLGNNSAYLKNSHRLFMIDCGSANFHRIVESDLLNGVNELTVLLTHLHPDHVGSLGDLIFYVFFKVNPICTPKLTVMTPRCMSKDFLTIMLCVGVTKDMFTHIEMTSPYVPENLCGISYIRSIRVEHSPQLACYGYLIRVRDKQIYYSGDASMIPDEILTMFMNGEIEFVYQDTCWADYQGNVHLSIKKLAELIPVEYRHRVWCMHIDADFSVQQAKRLGFQVVNSSRLFNSGSSTV